GRAGRQSRHNSAYWSGAAYVGLGPSAHGFDGCVRRWNDEAYVQWERRLAAGEDPIAGSEKLTAENRCAETVYLGLRASTGLELSDTEVRRARTWIDEGWGYLRDDRRLVLSALGWLRLDAIATYLTELRSR